MINTVIKIFIILILVIIQFTLMPLLAINGIWPNLLLICIVILLLLEYSEDALLLVCVGGLLLDLAGPMIFGVNILFFIGIYFFIQILLKKYISEINLFIVIVIVIFITTLYSLYIGFIIGINPSQQIVYQCLYNSICAILIFYLLQTFDQKKLLIKINYLTA